MSPAKTPTLLSISWSGELVQLVAKPSGRSLFLLMSEQLVNYSTSSSRVLEQKQSASIAGAYE